MPKPTDATKPGVGDGTAFGHLAQRIRRAGTPVESKTVYQWADELGFKNKSEPELRTQISRRFPQVEFSRPSNTFAWKDERADAGAAPLPRLPELLVQWANEQSADRRADLRKLMEESISALPADPPNISIARALGALDGAADWGLIPTDDTLPSALIGRLVECAGPAWLFDAATTLPSRLADAPKQKLQAFTAVERNEIAGAAIERWFRDDALRQGAASRLRRVKAAVGEQITPFLVTAAVCAAHELVATSSMDTETKRLLKALAALVAAADQEMTVDAIGKAFYDTEALRRWLIAVAAVSKNGLDRVALITAVAASSQRLAVFSPEVFRELDIETLGKILSRPEFEALIDRGLAAHVRSAVGQATPTKIGLALAAVAEFPVLEALLPSEFLSSLLFQDEPSARLSRRIAERLVDQAVLAERDVAGQQLEAVQAALAAANTRSATAKDEAQRADLRASAAELKWRETLGESGSARDAELRQAQINVLRAWAEQIESTRSVAGTLDRPELLNTQVSTSIRKIESFGIAVEGRTGDQVGYDPAVHHPIDVEPGSIVELVTPVYRLANSATPLLYGIVRRAAPDN